MSDEFLKVARQEIQSELNKLEQIVLQCDNDEHIFKNLQSIRDHLHKIKGLAPMIGEEKVAEIAKTIDTILKHIANNGALSGSGHAMTRTTQDMKKIFHGLKDYDMNDLKKMIHDKFPQVPDL